LLPNGDIGSRNRVAAKYELSSPITVLGAGGSGVVAYPTPFYYYTW
jgi:hypothetical protein